MSRPLRVERDNACYHVTSRGNRRATIFHSDSDRLTWLAMLAETCKRFDFVVLSYCLMGNHYHLVVQTLSGQLSRGMRYLNSNYSQYFNRQHGLTGHLFQGRYHAILASKTNTWTNYCAIRSWTRYVPDLSPTQAIGRGAAISQ